MNSGSASSGSPTIEFTVNGVRASVADDGCSLLEVLRDRIGIRSVKDGCSPQGQCGCCTVLIDGAARVACVTPARRVAGRAVTTIEGLDDAEEWAESFYATGASQCGFCTPGIVVRLAALGDLALPKPGACVPGSSAAVSRCVPLANPSVPSVPTRSHSRRESPSHNRVGLSWSESMSEPDDNRLLAAIQRNPRRASGGVRRTSKSVV
jgi:aerobic-type carbon monoxide dehydrogenase small subunit (CoxS/CutS family)